MTWALRLGMALGLLAALACPARAEEPEPVAPAGMSAEARRLVRLLDADDAYVRQEAFIQLEMLREAASAPEVRKRLESSKPETRAFSVRALAAIEGLKAVPDVIDRLKRDHDPRVRVSAILALEPLQNPAILPVFIERLRDRNRDVRMAAADAVSRSKQPEAHAALKRRWRRERDRDVRRILQQAMQRIEDSSG